MPNLSAQTLPPVTTSLPREYSVTEISQNIKSTLEQTFHQIRVRGELSGAKLHTSGHFYCALKERDAVLDAVCWSSDFKNLSFRPEDGMEVIGVGRITSYAGRSKYQIILKSFEIAGEGALLKALEDRKKRLAAEGLFADALKKPLPFIPRVIGIITSATGAVIRDILHRLADRLPTKVILWPVLVQGEGAAAQIAAAIKGFNNLDPQGSISRPDLLIVARGGGSLEDLWAFNEEIVVRAAAASVIPLISAVGHETDTTLIDYVADLRAPTPSAAAEKAVPVRAELYQKLCDLDKRSYLSLTRLYENYAQACDDRSGRLEHLKSLFFMEQLQKVQNLALRIKHPKEQIMLAEQNLKTAKEQLNFSGLRYLKDVTARLQQNAALLESFSYHNTLKRGFCAIKDDQQELISSSKDINSQDILNIQFHDGMLTARIF
ncbi:MAG: exodeoxyribonuclease VII large subunit [Janthinobacterium lividum]